MKVPFNDLKAQWQPLMTPIKQDIENIIDNTNFISAEIVENFENKLKKLHNVDNAIGVSDGTAALYLLLKAYDIGAGDEVIFPANTFIATAFAISMTGATPIPCDVDKSGLICAESINTRITKATKAVVAVHLFGCAVDLTGIKELITKNNILLFEDGAQSIANEFADMGKTTNGASISFYPGKNLGAFGQAGGILINDEKITNKIRSIANQGQIKKYIHKYKGGNFRLDAIQAVALNYGIDNIIEWTKSRQKIGKMYNKLLPKELLFIPENKNVYHIYPVVLPKNINRDNLIDKLNNCQVFTSIHYPVPVHKTEAYSELIHYKCENSEYLCDRILSLPIFTTMTEEQINYVVEQLLNNM